MCKDCINLGCPKCGTAHPISSCIKPVFKGKSVSDLEKYIEYLRCQWVLQNTDYDVNLSKEDLLGIYVCYTMKGKIE